MKNINTKYRALILSKEEQVPTNERWKNSQSIADFGPFCLFLVWESYFDKNLQSTIEFLKAKAVRWSQCCYSEQPHSSGKPFILPSLSRANAEENWNPGPLPLNGSHVKTQYQNKVCV